MKKQAKKRTYLGTNEVVRLVKEWDTKTTIEWADEFGTTYQSLSKVIKEIRLQDATLCPKQSKKTRSRSSIVTEALQSMKKK
jgi:hypothetical protein